MHVEQQNVKYTAHDRSVRNRRTAYIHVSSQLMHLLFALLFPLPLLGRGKLRLRVPPRTCSCLRRLRYKMFVAKGREFKFFGDAFKCPECGAGKNKFTEEDMDDDLLS